MTEETKTEEAKTEEAKTEEAVTQESAAVLEPKCPEYVQLWADSFSQVMAQITGAPAACRVLPGGAATERKPAGQGEDDLWIIVTAAGALRGEMSFCLSPASVLRLGQAFMSEPPAADSPLTADHRDSVIELLRQVSGMVSTSAKARWGELQLRLEGVATAPTWASAETFRLEAGAEMQLGMALELGLSAALVAELRAGKIDAAKNAAAKTAAAKTAVDSSPGIPPAASEPGALDRLMDVQLAVSMRFGSRRLLLREVLDLSPGAVVELDRRVQEPVDLLLDGRLVARGEVVVIDGNYGLRVSEVSPQALQPGQHGE
jgi:flagellar motor switch protein FliN/FliY